MSEPAPTTPTNPAPADLDALAPGSDEPRFGAPAEAGELGTLAGYRVQKLLGKGGMGAVYLALDAELNRPVALKVMLPRYAADARASERFRREARAAAAVKHDNVVTVYRVGQDERAGPFIAMEFLSGHPLDEYLRRKGRLTVPQALRVGAEAASGLAAAHALGLVHRDIKPANLWLEAPNGRVKILDFGLARPVDANTFAGDLTRTGQVVGTPAYMSPEQARGEAVDHRSDLFSLGVLLYQLCTGARPFDRGSLMANMIALGTEHPTPVRALNADVPEALERVIHHLLEKEPAARPQSGSEVAAALRALERGAGAPPGDFTVTQAVPQVVYVPIQVSEFEPNAAFAHLTDTSSGAPSSAVPEAEPVHRGRFPRWAVAALAALALGGAGAAALYFNRAPADVAKLPQPDPKQPDPKQPDPKQLVPPRAKQKEPDPQRAAAEWVLSKGGRLVLTTGQNVNALDDLPPLPGVEAILFERYAFADADVERLRPLLSLRHFVCAAPPALTDDGLAALLALPQAAEFTRLVVGSPKLSAKAVAGVTKCKKLTYLSLLNVPLAGQLGFVRDLPALEHLFVGNTGIGDADLAVLAEVPRLLSLYAFDNPGVTAKGLEALAGRVRLTALDLSRTGATGAGARVALNFPSLSWLAASGLTGDDARALCQLGLLQHVHFTDSPLGAGALAALGKLPELKSVDVSGSGVTDADLDAFAPPAALAGLTLNRTKVSTPAAKRFLARYPKCVVTFDYDPKADADRKFAEWAVANGGSVRVFGHTEPFTRTSALPKAAFRAYWVAFPLNGYSFTDADIDRFRDTGLTWFALAGPHAVTDDGLKKWAAFPEAARAQCVQLGNRTITAKGYAHLAAFKELTALHLPDSNVTDDALAVCKHLPKLQALSLERTPVGDAGLKHLEGSALEHLLLLETKVGDAGAASLATIPALTKLSLRGTQLTDAGLARLQALKNLTELDVTDTRVTKAGVEALHKALPTCTVKANPAK